MDGPIESVCVCVCACVRVCVCACVDRLWAEEDQLAEADHPLTKLGQRGVAGLSQVGEVQDRVFLSGHGRSGLHRAAESAPLLVGKERLATTQLGASVPAWRHGEGPLWMALAAVVIAPLAPPLAPPLSLAPRAARAAGRGSRRGLGLGLAAWCGTGV